jgi:hypothetical protein
MVFLVLLAAFVLVVIDLALSRGRSLTEWAVLILVVLELAPRLGVLRAG